jgi:hypothetical protein
MSGFVGAQHEFHLGPSQWQLGDTCQARGRELYRLPEVLGQAGLPALRQLGLQRLRANQHPDERRISLRRLWSIYKQSRVASRPPPQKRNRDDEWRGSLRGPRHSQRDLQPRPDHEGG